MENSPLELITYFYSAFDVQINIDEDHPPKEIPDKPDMDIDWNVTKAGDGNQFLVSVSIYIEWDDDAGAILDIIEVDINGVFWLPDDMSPALVKKYIPLSCVSCLLGIARGAIFDRTATFPSGGYILPLVNLAPEKSKTTHKYNPFAAHVNQEKVKSAKPKRK